MRQSDTLGIDISKHKLDAFRLSDNTHQVFANSPQGFRALLKWVGKNQPARVVFEATGAYHKAMEQTLSGRLPLVKVNPLQAKRFAQSTGARAKTDKADAKMLAQMGAALELVPDTPKDKDHSEIKELQTARNGLIKARTAAKNQLAQQRLALTKTLTRARLRQLEGQIAKLDAEIKSKLETCPKRKRKAEIIQSIPGIGRVLTHAILIEMPEIGQLTNKAAAALTGVAPYARQSGQWKGKAFIQGGRKQLRDALYMPALVATCFNPDLRAKYEALKKKGKPSKVAITAIMRKLIVLANTLVRENRIWINNHA